MPFSSCLLTSLPSSLFLDGCRTDLSAPFGMRDRVTRGKCPRREIGPHTSSKNTISNIVSTQRPPAGSAPPPPPQPPSEGFLLLIRSSVYPSTRLLLPRTVASRFCSLRFLREGSRLISSPHHTTRHSTVRHGTAPQVARHHTTPLSSGRFSFRFPSQTVPFRRVHHSSPQQTTNRHDACLSRRRQGTRPPDVRVPLRWSPHHGFSRKLRGVRPERLLRKGC